MRERETMMDALTPGSAWLLIELMVENKGEMMEGIGECADVQAKPLCTEY